MPLESATHITDLNTANPVGSTDKVQTLDDHVRLIKSVLKTDINLAGAVTASHTELNILDGATLSTAELNILDGVTLTAAQINDVARLSANPNAFTGVNTFTNAGGVGITSVAGLTITASGGGNKALLALFASGAREYRITASVTSGAFAIRDESGGADRLTIDTSGNFDFKAGTVTTNNASASEVGFKGVPQNVQDGNYTLVLTDAGKSIDKQAGGAGETITIPANASVAFPVGTVICGDNDGGGTLTIAITSDTLEDSAGNTGSRTVADNGSWQIKKIASTKWRITGSGIS